MMLSRLVLPLLAGGLAWTQAAQGTDLAAKAAAGGDPGQLARRHLPSWAWDADRLGSDLSSYVWLKYTNQTVPQALARRVNPPGTGHASRQGGEGPGDATPITSLPYSDTGTTTGYSNDVGPYDISAVWCAWNGYYSSTATGAAADVFYRISLTAESTVLEISLCAGTWDSTIGVFVDEDGAIGELVAGNDDYCGLTSELLTCPLPAGDYFIVVDGWGTSSSNYNLEVSEGVNPCEGYASTIQEGTAPLTMTGNTEGNTNVYGGTGGDAGLEITIPSAGRWDFDACSAGTLYAAALYLFDGSPCEGGSLITSSTNSTCTPYNPGRIRDLQLEAGTYHLLVGNAFTEEGSFEIVVQPTPGRPTEGGPDEMGYAWVNSDNAAGPAFDFVDISATGNQAALSDDSSTGPFVLGFDFPFYEDTYSQCWIGSNGYVSFTMGYSSLSSQPFPTPSNDNWSPNNFVAGFWDDLNPGAGGAVYYLSDVANGRFIVQWNNVPAFGNSIPMTWQIILMDTGEVLVQYQDMDENDMNWFSAGMENTDGSIGLEYSYHNEGGLVADGMAVSFAALTGDFRPPAVNFTSVPSNVETELPGTHDVEATITDETGVASATLYYTVNGGAQQSVAMVQQEGTLWRGGIPHQSAGTTVAWHVVAVDATEEGNTRTTATQTFTLVSYTWPPQNLQATDGNPMNTVITWLPPVNPTLLADAFGDNLPRTMREAVGRLVMEQGLTKEAAIARWEEWTQESARQFDFYRVYRNGQALGTTTNTTWTDNASGGAQQDVVYSYTVRAQFTAGESNASNSDNGNWALPTTPNSGGPDIEGYTWVCTPNAQAPAYEWTDISTIGVNTGITGDDSQATVTLPWSFPWYQGTYSTAYVSSNGYITFQTTATPYWNGAIPSTPVPNDVIYALWDDLYVAGGASAIYTYNDTANSRFIVQWTAVTPLGSNTTPHTFQIILYATGRARVVYHDLSQAQVTDVTVGTENAGGTDGLQVNYDSNGAYLGNEMVVAFSTPVGPDIVHTPLGDIETEIAGAYAISASITSDVTVNSASVVYTVNGGNPVTSALTHGAGNTWTGSIAHQNAGSMVSYHLEAVDASGTRLSQTWNFDVVSYHNPPLNVSASDGQQMNTVITWQAPAGIGLSTWFGQDIPANEDAAVARLMAEQGMGKMQAATMWRQLLDETSRQFIQYRVYRNGQLLGETTGTSYTDNQAGGAQADVVYTYGVTALFTAGESNSATDTGFWSAPPSSGGPDAFGYLWVSSASPTGPDYNWTDISATGTALNLMGDDAGVQQNLPFTFPWYGNFYTGCYVSTNGYVTFQSTATPYWNQGIPNSAAPNDVVYALWDDLYVGTNGSAVYYQEDLPNERVIFQWNNVTPLGSQNPLTFQIILSASGIATVQYEDITEGEVLDSTVGTENADGSIGLQVQYDTTGPGIFDNMAIAFLPPSNCEPVECTGVAEQEPNEGWNDNNASWNVIRCDQTRCGTILAAPGDTDTDWYLYTHFGGDITVSLDVSDFNGRLTLREQALNGQIIAEAGSFPRCFNEAFSVSDLTGGAYYIVVEHTGEADVLEPATYALSVQCSGDPCSGHVPVQCAGTSEVEPNEGWNASPPNSSYGTILRGQTICGSTWANAGQRDMDWYRFTLSEADTVTFTCLIDAFDAALFLTDVDPSGSILAEVNDAPACAPETLSFPNLPAGDYYIVIGNSSFDGVPEAQNYALAFGSVAQPEDPCDNYVDAGNFHDIYTVVRPAPSRLHHSGTGCPGGISSPGLDEVTRLVLSQVTDLQVTLIGEGMADEVILLLGNCAQPSSSCGAARDVNGADAGGEVLTIANVPVGDYFLVADFAGEGETHPYVMTIIDMESGQEGTQPIAFNLDEAHPNPFNPTTTLAWTQPKLSKASLRVHDLRGALVEELDLGLRGAGRHEVVWDATRFSSGVYFLTLQAGEDAATRKAVLMK